MMKKLTSLLLSAALMISLLACGAFAAKTKSGVRIAGLKGPTTMGLVNLLDMERSGKASQHYDLQLYGAADEIVPKLIKGELDMAAIPANLAATLYQKTNGGSQVMAVNTLGVLYVVEKGDSVHSFADLKGRTILSTGKGTTPEYVLRYILEQNGLDPDKDVTILFAEASEITQKLMTGEAEVAMLPVPAATALMMKDEGVRQALSLSDEWDKLGQGSLAMGCVVGRTQFIEEHPETVDAFLDLYGDSITFMSDEHGGAGAAAMVGELGITANEQIAAKALPQCNLTFITGADMKATLEEYYQVLFQANPASIGGSMHCDAVYIGAE